jgi:hypothetical protein
MASPIENSDWLQWIEGLVCASPVTARLQGHVCARTGARYYCCIDDQPDFLVPARLRHFFADEYPHDCQWVFNPQCSLEAPDSIELSDQYFAHSGTTEKIVWAQDPITRSAMPYWLGPESSRALAGAQPGSALPERIPAATMRALKAAGIMIERERTDRASEKWRGNTESCRKQFRERGYLPVGRLIHPFHLAALRRYYRYHLRRGDFRLGDSQNTSRYVAFDEPVARFFHHQLTGRISEIAGEAVKPSYCYFSSYAEGSVLEKHTDREQCEFSVSMCIDYSPEPEVATPWPLRLHIEGGQVRVFQALGDALLYRGRNLPHSRSRLPAGQSSTSIFFHFVRQDFAGPLN